MSYIKAETCLPQDLLEQIQQYIDGGYIYIPRKNENRKEWGESTNSKIKTQKRNNQIYSDYLNGMNTSRLSETYFLSIKSIQRIILEEKRKNASVQEVLNEQITCSR